MILGELVVLLFIGAIYRRLEISWERKHSGKNQTPNSNPSTEVDMFSMTMMLEQDL